MAETRRSSRIAAQPKKEEAPKPARKPTKKRSTGEPGGEDGPAAKKVKNDEKDTETKEGEQPADESVGDAKVEGPESQADNAVKSIDVGDSLPSLTLKNEKGEDVDVSTLTAEKGVILFLVPKADTPGCTTQACGFRDAYPNFTEVGYDVYCLSADSPTAQSKWQTKKELPYPLLSDPKRVLITALGAGEGGKTKRSHFIFEKGGKLIKKELPVKPADSPSLALEFVKSLNKAEESDKPMEDVQTEEKKEAEPAAEPEAAEQAAPAEQPMATD
ncbi:AhpC-TSA-domain-containing protein [Phanerochaete sordida]|uniref:thioredoxin-dependent peroxiredoxin n=1 Tax=Phanerochaete sordida TaxID=48140 RepID=A0A9P3GAJ8_9APHY|nr:AhpC-TSA-domain-containing protein [Phanerochaete sordida]